MKALSYLTTGLCAIMLTFSSGLTAGPYNAIDWVDYGFTTGTNPYNQTHNGVNIFVTTLGTTATVTPSSGNGDVVLSGSPIANESDLPVLKLSQSSMSINTGYNANMQSTNSAVVAPSGYVVIGGLMDGDRLNFGFFNSSVSIVGVFSNLGTFLPGGDTSVMWDMGTGAFSGITGYSGAVVFQNNSGTTLQNITFGNNGNNQNPLYFAVTTPEPSTYLAMAGGLGVLALLALRRKAKAKA